MTWDTSVTSVTIGGPAAGSVATSVSYEDGDQTVVLDVTTNFLAGDQISIDDLMFTNFSAVSPIDNLELDVDDNGAGDAFDDKTVAIVNVTLSSAANQSFTVGASPIFASTLTVSDDASTPVITANDDIRLRVPSAFNMSWDTTVTAVTLGGSASGKASTAVTYEDSGKTAVIDVTTNFAAGDILTVLSLRLADFAAPSITDNLELEVFDDGVVTAENDKTIDIVAGASVSILSAPGPNVLCLEPRHARGPSSPSLTLRPP